MTKSEKQTVLAAHTAVNRIAADVDANRPGPYQLGAVVEALRAAVAPLEPLVADPEPKAEGEGSEGEEDKS